jgi:HEPN domain-containing protein
MAEERLKDAEVLFAGGRWAFAYYVAGYAVECALKACPLKRMVIAGWVFDEDVKRVDECRTHEFDKLIRISGMLDDLKQETRRNAAFLDHWEIVTQWKVKNRYDEKAEGEARKLIAATTDEPNGVMTWIRNFW